MTAATAIHWHGIELDSYFDGVPGWGGTAGNITPPIAAGQRFTAKFAPPRAGTYIYHTHWHDEAQLTGGLYGALIVLEPASTTIPPRITSSSRLMKAQRCQAGESRS